MLRSRSTGCRACNPWPGTFHRGSGIFHRGPGIFHCSPGIFHRSPGILITKAHAGDE